MKRKMRMWGLAAAGMLLLRPAMGEEILDVGGVHTIKIGDYSLPEVKWKFDTVGAFQSLKQRNDSHTLNTLTPGFQAAVANAHLLAHMTDGLDIYAEWYLSSKHHPGQVTDRQGYLMISGLPDSLNIGGANKAFEYVNLKVGHFEPDFGNQHWIRSDNADVQRNPLIGNYLIDPNTTEAGAELIGRYGVLHGLVGIGNGVTVDNFIAGNEFSRHAKLWIEPKSKKFNLAASVYRVNHSRLNPAVGESEGSEVEMFARMRSGSHYSGVIDQNPWDDNQAEAGQPSMGVGSDVTAWQFDASVHLLDNVALDGMYGIFRDADLNFNGPGRPEEKWYYYGGQVKYDVTKNFWLASRYSVATTPVLQGVPMNGHIHRVQLGLGYRVLSGLLFKAEYVVQRYLGFSQAVPVLAPGGTAQIDYTGNPRFSGLLGEVSMAFGGTLFQKEQTTRRLQ